MLQVSVAIVTFNVLKRLEERGALASLSVEDRRLLIEREAFLGHRTAERSLARTRAILSELRGGGYDRHARGWRTALADLLYPRK